MKIGWREPHRIGDPALSAAIDQESTVSACRLESRGSCSRTDHEAFASVSEFLRIGTREAVVLASHVTVTNGGVVSRELFFPLRFGNGEWRVIRV
jgi:hypothetical protein